MAQVRCEVGALVTLGAGPFGERRCVPLLRVAASRLLLLLPLLLQLLLLLPLGPEYLSRCS